MALEPGESKTVTFALTPEDLSVLDTNMHWVVFPGDFDVMVGRSALDLPLKGVLKVVK